MTITVYTTPSCQQCNATKRQLKLRDQPYEPVDVSEDPEAYDFVTNTLGYKEAPVVVIRKANEIIEHWSGFRPDRLKAVMAAA